jgi:hypothetical protein
LTPYLGSVLESEYNDDRTAANQAFFMVEVKGSLSGTGDQDWFYFDSTATNGYINVSFDVSSMNFGVWNVYWYGPMWNNESDMNVLTGRNISPPSFAYSFPAFRPGRYYLRIMSSAPSLYNGGMYTVKAVPSP